jgi:hypothetical protein
MMKNTCTWNYPANQAVPMIEAVKHLILRGRMTAMSEDEIVMNALRESDKLHDMELEKYREVISALASKLKTATDALEAIHVMQQMHQGYTGQAIAREALAKIKETK